MVEVTKELWDQMVKDIAVPWYHYMPDGYTSIYARVPSNAVKLGYTKDNKYYMIEGLYEEYMRDDEDLPF